MSDLDQAENMPNYLDEWKRVNSGIILNIFTPVPNPCEGEWANQLRNNAEALLNYEDDYVCNYDSTSTGDTNGIMVVIKPEDLWAWREACESMGSVYETHV